MGRRVAIVGVTGYVGLELALALSRHRGVEICGVFASASSAGRRLGAVFPRARKAADLAIEEASSPGILAKQPEVVLLATPHELSHELAPVLLEGGARVVDLSAAYRLRDAGVYRTFYGFEHRHEGWLERAVYGLPELNRERIVGARLVASPGCYPTCSILALAPLVRAGALDGAMTPVIDAMSGVSGAGRGASERTHFCEVTAQAYGVFKHRHTPEIEAHAGTRVVFTPHLVALDRGMIATVHARLRAGWTRARVEEAWREAYGEEAFVRLLPEGEWPSAGAVRGTNYCDLACAVRGTDLIAGSAIDNLLKGAAGQAVQCLNLMLGLEEGEGLEGAA